MYDRLGAVTDEEDPAVVRERLAELLPEFHPPEDVDGRVEAGGEIDGKGVLAEEGLVPSA